MKGENSSFHDPTQNQLNKSAQLVIPLTVLDEISYR